MSWLARFFDTPGNGGLMVLSVVTALLVAFALTLRWIYKGGAKPV